MNVSQSEVVQQQRQQFDFGGFHDRNLLHYVNDQTGPFGRRMMPPPFSFQYQHPHRIPPFDCFSPCGRMGPLVTTHGMMPHPFNGPSGHLQFSQCENIQHYGPLMRREMGPVPPHFMN